MDEGVGMTAPFDSHLDDAFWQVIEDLRDSYRLAMKGIVEESNIAVIENIVTDYITNHYGDD